jgi:hypothetical protein
VSTAPLPVRLPAFVLTWVAALLWPAPAAVAQAAEDRQAQAAEDPHALGRLDRAIAAADTTPHRGTMTVVSFGSDGPQITVLEVARGPEGGLRVERRGAWELGRDAAGAYLHSARTGRLLRIGGLDPAGFHRERFLAAYTVLDAGAAQLDTGPARALEIRRRAGEALAEVLYVDDATGLVVRRETFGRDGRPVRVVAFVALTVDDVREVVGPSADGDDRPAGIAPLEPAEAVRRGIPVREQLPGGYVLVGVHEVPGSDGPIVRLSYDDGLYRLSLYVQDGQLAAQATQDAARMATDTGGVVWRWPGAEPRRVVWSGDGRTFTVVSDAPTDDVIAAVADLPNDPPPSTLARLTRGLIRVAKQLIPFWD